MIRSEIREEADGIVLQGGEIPEVALYESLNHLQKIGIQITGEELRHLREAVIRRYRDIILRDLTPENVVHSFFRGPERARINHQRLRRFTQNTLGPGHDNQEETGRLLMVYLRHEADRIGTGRDYNTLGMTEDELRDMLKDVGIDPADLDDLIDRVCRVRSLDFNKAIAAERRGRRG